MIVVLIFEELFWQSLLIRRIINQDFKTIPTGRLYWLTFLLTIPFFELELYRWLVGMFAGAIYKGFLYKETNIMPCSTAYAVANLILGVYVLTTQEWGFWLGFN